MCNRIVLIIKKLNIASYSTATSTTTKILCTLHISTVASKFPYVHCQNKALHYNTTSLKHIHSTDFLFISIPHIFLVVKVHRHEHVLHAAHGAARGVDSAHLTVHQQQLAGDGVGANMVVARTTCFTVTSTTITVLSHHLLLLRLVLLVDLLLLVGKLEVLQGTPRLQGRAKSKEEKKSSRL